jgi:hypothetical protein
MARRKYKAQLSVAGIENLKKELLDYKNNTLQYKIELLAKTLAEMGVDYAQVNVAKLDAIFTGELINSIHTRYGGSAKGIDVFYVVADSEHAVYVEMGTGIVGAKSSYPGKVPVIYAQGEKIHRTENGKYGWFYQNAEGDWYFTEGMHSRPFMYNASKQLETRVVKTAKEIFRV